MDIVPLTFPEIIPDPAFLKQLPEYSFYPQWLLSDVFPPPPVTILRQRPEQAGYSYGHRNLQNSIRCSHSDRVKTVYAGEEFPCVLEHLHGQIHIQNRNTCFIKKSLTFDFRYLLCRCGHNPYSHIAHIIKESTSSCSRCVFFSDNVSKRNWSTDML